MWASDVGILRAQNEHLPPANDSDSTFDHCLAAGKMCILKRLLGRSIFPLWQVNESILNTAYTLVVLIFKGLTDPKLNPQFGTHAHVVQSKTFQSQRHVC